MYYYSDDPSHYSACSVILYGPDKKEQIWQNISFQSLIRLRQDIILSVFVWNVVFPWFGFAELRAIYKWQNGETLPSVDNLYALGTLLNVPMEQILITVSMLIQQYEQQDVSCCSFLCNCFRHDRKTVRFSHFPSYTADEYITISRHFGSVQYHTLIFRATDWRSVFRLTCK